AAASDSAEADSVTNSAAATAIAIVPSRRLRNPTLSTSPLPRAADVRRAALTSSNVDAKSGR
ncbi:MAG: hypothetical protein ABI399_12600, partial [Bauldia sp.]